MFYIPQIVLFGAAERNVDLNYLKGVFFFHLLRLYAKLGVCPALVQICSFDSSYFFIIIFFLKKLLTVLFYHRLKKRKRWSPPKDIKWRIYSHHIFEWRATKPYKVSFGTVRFCFLCLALLVFSPCCYRVPTISLSFIFIGI